jgi:hypothetical protein
MWGRIMKTRPMILPILFSVLSLGLRPSEAFLCSFRSLCVSGFSSSFSLVLRFASCENNLQNGITSAE